jgi:alkylation response protein AidB-like acyl-CoA dehydrogenase
VTEAGDGSAAPAEAKRADAERAAVRADVRRWVDRHWHTERSLLEWRRLLVDGGWAAPSWPVDWYGRGLPDWADGVASAELAVVRAPGPPPGVGTALAAPTLLAHGSDDLKRLLLRPILTGEHVWCQLFSEPGAGSDLAGLVTRAERDGDQWLVTGQKVWSTSAHHADFGLLLARSDWDLPKHRGITCFVLPMRQVGVEVRPLRQMNEHASFNEVFLTEARVPPSHVIGEVGGGWSVALTTLAYERLYGVAMADRDGPVGGSRAAAEAEIEAAEHRRTYAWYPQRAGRPDLLVPRARAGGRAADVVVRQQVAAVEALVRANRWTEERARSARALGRPPGPEGSLGKLGTSVVARAAAWAHSLIGGAAGLLAGSDAALAGDAGAVAAEVLVSVPAQSIAGGTDEIQKTILADRVLGLPREPQPERDLPFRAIAHG